VKCTECYFCHYCEHHNCRRMSQQMQALCVRKSCSAFVIPWKSKSQQPETIATLTLVPLKHTSRVVLLHWPIWFNWMNVSYIDQSFCEEWRLLVQLIPCLLCTNRTFLFQMLLLLKAGSNWKKYFINRRTLLTNGFFGSLFVSFENNMKLLRILKRHVLQNV